MFGCKQRHKSIRFIGSILLHAIQNISLTILLVALESKRRLILFIFPFSIQNWPDFDVEVGAYFSVEVESISWIYCLCLIDQKNFSRIIEFIWSKFQVINNNRINWQQYSESHATQEKNLFNFYVWTSYEFDKQRPNKTTFAKAMRAVFDFIFCAIICFNHAAPFIAHNQLRSRTRLNESIIHILY